MTSFQITLIHKTEKPATKHISSKDSDTRDPSN